MAISVIEQFLTYKGWYRAFQGYIVKNSRENVTSTIWRLYYMLFIFDEYLKLYVS